MKYYELLEGIDNYFLMLNGVTVKTYSKQRFSKQEAEDKASEEVSKAVKKFGYKNVEYNGCYAV